MQRLIVFVDLWNFQLNWNRITDKGKCDWKVFPKCVCA